MGPSVSLDTYYTSSEQSKQINNVIINNNLIFNWLETSKWTRRFNRKAETISEIKFG